MSKSNNSLLTLKYLFYNSFEATNYRISKLKNNLPLVKMQMQGGE